VPGGGYFNGLPTTGLGLDVLAEVTINRDVNNGVVFITCTLDGDPLTGPDPRNISTDCPTVVSRKFRFRHAWEGGKLDTIFTPTGLGRRGLAQIYEDCYGNAEVNEGGHVKVPLAAGELANRRLEKVTSSKRFSREACDNREGGLHHRSVISGKTYLTLKQR
jgi:hypothetical protein